MFKRIFMKLKDLSPAAIREIIIIIIILCISIAISLPQLKEDMEKAKILNEPDTANMLMEGTTSGEADYGIFGD